MRVIGRLLSICCTLMTIPATVVLLFAVAQEDYKIASAMALIIFTNIIAANSIWRWLHK